MFRIDVDGEPIDEQWGHSARDALVRFINAQRGWRAVGDERTNDSDCASYTVCTMADTHTRFVVTSTSTGQVAPHGVLGSVIRGKGGVDWVVDDGGRFEARVASGQNVLDQRDCVTRALAIISGQTFRDVRQMLCDQAATMNVANFDPDKGVSNYVWVVVAQDLGLVPLGMANMNNLSVRRAVDEFPTVMMETSAHVMTAIDGQVRDTFDSTRKRVKRVWVRYDDLPDSVTP